MKPTFTKAGGLCMSAIADIHDNNRRRPLESQGK
jgi:hypothetical protein